MIFRGWYVGWWDSWMEKIVRDLNKE